VTDGGRQSGEPPGRGRDGRRQRRRCWLRPSSSRRGRPRHGGYFIRARRLDAGSYTFARIDALTQKVREGGRTVNVHALIATGVNADGRREFLGLDVASSEDGAGWLAFLRGLVARGCPGVQLVTSDCQSGPARCDRRGAARRRVAVVQDALPPQSAHPGAQARAAVGVHAGAHHLRAARRRPGPRPASPGRDRAGGQVPGCGQPPGRGPRRHPGLHRLPREVWRQVWSNNPSG